MFPFRKAEEKAQGRHKGTKYEAGAGTFSRVLSVTLSHG